MTSSKNNNVFGNAVSVNAGLDLHCVYSKYRDASITVVTGLLVVVIIGLVVSIGKVGVFCVHPEAFLTIK